MQDAYNPYMMAAGQGGNFGMIPEALAAYFMKNPAQSAMKYYNQIPGELQGYYNPYIQAGMGAMGTLRGQYGRLINNPTSVMNQIGQGYQSSPGYAWQRNQALQAANNAAASGGMGGSMQNQQFDAQIANNLANQNYYDYVDRGLGSYGMGIQGEQGLNQQGFNASNELAQSLANTYMNQGNLAMSGQGMQNNLWGSILGMI